MTNIDCQPRKNTFQTDNIIYLSLSPTLPFLNSPPARHPAGDHMAVTRNVNHRFPLTACVRSASGANLSETQ